MIQYDNAIEYFGNIILKKLAEAKVKCWVAGGSVRDYWMGRPGRGDIDIFFPSNSDFEAARDFLLKHPESKTIWESDNGMKILYDGRKFDLVKKFFSTPEETIQAFDFTVSMFAIDDKTVYQAKTSFIDLSRRQLMINKITYPASTMSRVLRHYQKGFRICNQELKKIIEAIQDMPKIADNNQQPSGDPENQTSGDEFFAGID